MASNNPFASSSGAWGSPAGDWDAPPPSASVALSSKGAAPNKDADAREAQLNQKEAELRRLELELRSTGARRKNWPRCCPIAFHDIPGEVPAALQGMVRCAYLAWLGLVLCMCVNFVVTIAVLIGVGGSNLSSFLWAGIYLVGGIPGAWLLWYRRLYNASKSDGAFGYAVYFAFFMGHLVFVGWSAVAPPILMSWSHTGFWSASELIGKKLAVGIIYYIGAGLWSAEFLWSFWTLKMVYSGFRGRGLTARDVKREAAAKAVVAAV